MDDMPDSPPPDLDLRLVRYFTVVAEHRHFGRAAAALLIAQPSLSRQIRHLEQQLGARLLDRTPRGTQLTEAGEVFLPRAKALLRSAAQAAAATRAAAQPSRITIGYTSSIIITPAVRQLRHQHPDAEVHTLHLPWNEPREALLDHRVDAAVTRLPIRTDGLHVTILYDEPRRAADPPATTAWPARNRSPSATSPTSPYPGCPTRPGTPTGASTRGPTEAPPPTAPSSRPSRTSSSSSPPARPSPSSRPGAGRQPPPRPHHRPAARRRAEPRRAGHPRRRPQSPGGGLPQVRPGPPHRPRVELFASVKFRRLTDPRNLPISGSVQAPPHHSRPQVHQKSGQRVT